MRSLAALAVLLSWAGSAGAAPLVIKVASVAPRGSIWSRIFRRYRREVGRITRGQVDLRLYPGQVQGDERDVVRKMRTGQLDGAALTSVGLSLVNPEVLVMQMPGMFRDYATLDRARARLSAYFVKSFARRGYVLLGWGEIGKVYMFSKYPVRTLAQLRKRKIWVWRDDAITKAMMRRLKISPRLLALPAVLPALSTGMVDTVFNSALGCVALQWHAKLRYRAAQSAAIGVGASIVRRPVWLRIPARYRARLRRLSRRYHRALSRRIRRDNKRALETLARLGIKTISGYTKSDRKAVVRAAIAVTKSFVPRFFSRRLLEQVLAARKP